MLSVTLTPLSLGVTISGTEDDLMDLHEAISDILPEDDDGIDIEFTRGLKYDLRKAWNGKRTVETKKLPIIENSSIHVPQKIYSVEVLLPNLICQIHILLCYVDYFYLKREISLKLIEHLNQELIYKIEEKSPDAAQFYVNWLENNAPFSANYLFLHVDLINSEYIKLSGERIDYLEDVIESLTEGSESYNITSILVENAAERLECDKNDVYFDAINSVYDQLDKGEHLW